MRQSELVASACSHSDMSILLQLARQLEEEADTSDDASEELMSLERDEDHSQHDSDDESSPQRRDSWNSQSTIHA